MLQLNILQSHYMFCDSENMNLLSLKNDSTTDVLRPADGIECTDIEHLNMLLETVCTDLNVF